MLTILYMFFAILEVASLHNDSLWSTKAAVVEYFCMLYMVGTTPFCISKFAIDTKLAALSVVFIALPGLVLYHHVKLDDLYSSQTEFSIALEQCYCPCSLVHSKFGRDIPVLNMEKDIT